MSSLDDRLETISIWVLIAIFGGFTVALPRLDPTFFDIRVRPLPLNNTLSPIIEAESLVIHSLSAVDLPRFNNLFKPGDSRLEHEASYNKGKPLERDKPAEQLNESTEFPRPGQLSAPTGLGIRPQ
jgi:hypothetical protein